LHYVADTNCSSDDSDYYADKNRVYTEYCVIGIVDDLKITAVTKQK